MHEQNRLIIISGCSGGGKSTLITELGKKGHAVVHEVARCIVREQLAVNGDMTPWKNPLTFSKLLIARSMEDFYTAKAMTDVLNNVIFFDRSFLEGIRYYKMLNPIAPNLYDSFINYLRYFDTVFIAPPWEKIYCQDEERKHSFQKSIDDYERLFSFYPKCGYKTLELPKVDISGRVEFVLSSIYD
ncbi:MAG: AAA family ATPase [Tatlockia sp.]|nr:AAA family ATPase [Tatlockia sp.]